MYFNGAWVVSRHACVLPFNNMKMMSVRLPTSESQILSTFKHVTSSSNDFDFNGRYPRQKLILECFCAF